MSTELPRYITVFDTETTGLSSDDRVITLGAIRLDTSGIEHGDVGLSSLHLVFDPGRPCHPRAAAVHGWSDRMLRGQDAWDDHDDAIRDMLSADLVVAHNFSFDFGFVDREFRRSGAPFAWPRHYCTMQARRQAGRPGKLDTAVADLGIRRVGDQHGALEDAYLALLVFLAQNGRSAAGIDPTPFLVPPSNLRRTAGRAAAFD